MVLYQMIMIMQHMRATYCHRINIYGLIYTKIEMISLEEYNLKQMT